ncbi:GGDEF domain-containing protein [Novosphingobium resinovorum]|uniref:GGDEF domain-containing protein n=1 Tax=Novosphingobium resinovorum TaxID=158500 RepID=UPI002ED35B08|nr:GGDEF domain-containing protein [Novosphingobium resinovorum]
MPVSLVEWAIPAAMLLCGLGFMAAGVMGFPTVRWGGALCFLGSGFALMLIQTVSLSIVKPITEDALILLGVAFACRALLQRFGYKAHPHLELAIIASTGLLAMLSLLLFKNVRLETFFTQIGCFLILLSCNARIWRSCVTLSDRILLGTFIFFALVMAGQCAIYIAVDDPQPIVGAWRQSVWGSLVQYTGLFGSIILTFAVMIAVSLDHIEKYRRDAQVDPLTALLNRRGLEAFLASNRGRAFVEGTGAVLMADIDHFKAINDRFGHQFGDKVLADFGAVLRDHVNDLGCTVRLGGEEFAILLPGTSLDQAVALAERMRQALEVYPWSQCTTDCIVTASFGVTRFERDEPFASAIARADKLLYRAKRDGRNCTVADSPSIVVSLRPLHKALV